MPSDHDKSPQEKMITYRKEKFSGYNKPKRTPGKSKRYLPTYGTKRGRKTT